MSKEVVKVIKLQIQAGKANPAPPVGPALGQAGVNIMDFCKQFNDRTKDKEGPTPVIISVYKDKKFDFVTKLAATSYLIKKELGIEKGSTAPGLTIVKKMTKEQVKKVAKAKMPDFNTDDVYASMLIVAGQARSMGIDVEKFDEASAA
ncbi:MAG: 50S ribosomal protein L11 [Rickettsiales bacterium]|nr:50S ribosomal protein L11 [Rickettsiales bacterium]